MKDKNIKWKDIIYVLVYIVVLSINIVFALLFVDINVIKISSSIFLALSFLIGIFLLSPLILLILKKEKFHFYLLEKKLK